MPIIIPAAWLCVSYLTEKTGRGITRAKAQPAHEQRKLAGY